MEKNQARTPTAVRASGETVRLRSIPGAQSVRKVTVMET